MSYDLWFETTVDGHPVTLEEIGNHTSNTSGMWHEALKATGKGNDWGLRCLEGKTGREIEARLAEAVRDMEARPEHYQKQNPPNGWGSYETALDYLRKCLAGARKWPSGILVMSY